MSGFTLNPAPFTTPLVVRAGLGNPIVLGPLPPAGTPQPITVYPAAPVPAASGAWEFEAGTTVVVEYFEQGASFESEIEAHTLGPIEIFMGQGAVGPAVPGSVRFVFRGRTYVDRSGTLVHSVDPLTNAGTLGGTFDYANCVATVTDYGSGSNTVTVVSLLTRYVEPGVSSIFFRAPGAPLVEGQFVLRATTFDGTLITGNADINGTVTGDHMSGEVDWVTGMARVAFGEYVTAAGNEGEPWYDGDAVDSNGEIWRPMLVDAQSVFFGCVIARRIPVDPELVGLDPVRLPPDGRVLGFNVGAPGVISHTQETIVNSPIAGATEDLGRTGLRMLEVYDADMTPIESVWYTRDMAAGTLTWADPLNLSAYTMPVMIRDRIQFAAQVADVEVNGRVVLAAAVPRAFPSGSVFSAVLPFGDTQARVTNLFDQQTWGSPGVWQDVVNGSPAAANYNDITYPIEVENDSATNDRWAFVFQTASTVLLLCEEREAMGPYSIDTDIAPINAVSGKPFFTIRKEGWGVGWAPGNALRFNTVSATHPIWLGRVTLPGEITETHDDARINVSGNAN